MDGTWTEMDVEGTTGITRQQSTNQLDMAFHTLGMLMRYILLPSGLDGLLTDLRAMQIRDELFERVL